MILLKLFYRIYVFLTRGKFYWWVVDHFEVFNPISRTKGNESPNDFRSWLKFKLGGNNGTPYWPMSPTSRITGSWKNVYVGIDVAPGISPGCYIQAVGKIFIDDYTQIAPNVGLISSNHFMLDIRKHVINHIKVGKYCRIGMGSIILPGVELGDFTTVAAGSIVTKSFPRGYCVISGNPAEIIQDYSSNEKLKEKFILYKNEFEYNGFIPSTDFAEYRSKYLNV